MEAILFILLGMFIGWNLPQPPWAKCMQACFMDFLRNLFAKEYKD